MEEHWGGRGHDRSRSRLVLMACGSLLFLSMPAWAQVRPGGVEPESFAARADGLHHIGLAPRSQGQSTGAPASRVMVGAEVDFESRLVVRGLAFTRSPVLQPAIWISGSGFAFLLRGNLDLGDEPTHPRFNEIDLVVSAGRSLGKVRVDVAVPFFVLIESEAPDSGELVLSVSYPTRWVQLFTTHAFDIVAHEGSYFGEVGVGYARAARTTLALDGSLKIGFANKKFHEVYVGPEETGLHHAAVEVALTYSARRMRIRPHVAFTRLIDNRGEDPLGRPDNLAGGVTISWRL